MATRRPSRPAAVAAVAIALAAAVCVGTGYYQQRAAVLEMTARQAERANADLQDALAKMRDQLGATNQSLNLVQNRLTVLNDAATRQQAAAEQAVISKGDRITQMATALEQAQKELHLTEAQRVTLMARLSKAENDLAAGQARQHEAQAGVDQWQRKIQDLTADRDRAAAERDQLRNRLGELEKRLSLQQTREPSSPMAAAPMPAPAVAAAAPPHTSAPAPVAATPAPVAAAPQPQQQVAVIVPGRPEPTIAAVPAAPAVAVAPGRLGQFERVLASAGVDVAHLFAQYGMRTGEGGPFIPAPRGARLESTLSPEKLAALGRLMNVLPVSAPLQNYEIGSPFGFRHDPINGRSSLHTGIDLIAPYMTPVYATAPGVVTFSGYRDDYGKIVEIDHGNGISTRYAHLHRAIVSVGQRVAAHSQIGFLGSSGRATGPHVHYEVLVNGEPQDPAKFLGLAQIVAVAQR